MRIVMRRKIVPEDLDVNETLRIHPQYGMIVKEYEEEGEIAANVEEELSPEVLRRLMSKRMVEILEILERGELINISELARKLGRSIPNVYYDLQFMEKHRIIYLRKMGSVKIPILLLEEIRVEVD
ncbi:MAG TPA: ArsR family transcriptional regulator [Thermofilum sp.]|nr:ArsR family transcriptional regulator [Thermofilum sp.]